jgi:hypothetical protein
MIFWTRGRRLLLAAILISLVAVSMMIGFLTSVHTEYHFHAVDLRKLDTAQAVAQVDNPKNSLGLPVVMLAAPCQINSPVNCQGNIKKIDVAQVRTKPIAVVFTDDAAIAGPALLQSIYGPDTTAVTVEGLPKSVLDVSRSTDVGFGENAAIVTAILLIPLCALLVLAQLSAGAPARPIQVAPVPEHRQPQPRTARVPMQPTAQPGQPARTVRVEPRSTSALRPLVTDARERAVARTHVTKQGGYVELGDTVVWAVLSGTSVAAPGDHLSVLRVDDKAETLVVGSLEPSLERGTRP